MEGMKEYQNVFRLTCNFSVAQYEIINILSYHLGLAQAFSYETGLHISERWLLLRLGSLLSNHIAQMNINSQLNA